MAAELALVSHDLNLVLEALSEEALARGNYKELQARANAVRDQFKVPQAR